MDNALTGFCLNMNCGVHQLSKKALRLFLTLPKQLTVGQRIQYVTVEPGAARQELLDHGLIKPTKKPGFDRFVVPKDVMFLRELDADTPAIEFSL